RRRPLSVASLSFLAKRYSLGRRAGPIHAPVACIAFFEQPLLNYRLGFADVDEFRTAMRSRQLLRDWLSNAESLPSRGAKSAHTYCPKPPATYPPTGLVRCLVFRRFRAGDR